MLVLAVVAACCALVLAALPRAHRSALVAAEAAASLFEAPLVHAHGRLNGAPFSSACLTTRIAPLRGRPVLGEVAALAGGVWLLDIAYGPHALAGGLFPESQLLVLWALTGCSGILHAEIAFRLSHGLPLRIVRTRIDGRGVAGLWLPQPVVDVTYYFAGGEARPVAVAARSGGYAGRSAISASQVTPGERDALLVELRRVQLRWRARTLQLRVHGLAHREQSGVGWAAG